MFSRALRVVQRAGVRRFTSGSDLPRASGVISQSLRQASENSYVPQDRNSESIGESGYGSRSDSITDSINSSIRRERESIRDFARQMEDEVAGGFNSREFMERIKQRHQLRDSMMKQSHEFPIDSFETPDTVRDKGGNIEVLTRWEAVELMSCAKKQQGMNWKDLAKKLDVSEAYVASIFLGLQSVDKDLSNKLMEVLDIKDRKIRGGIDMVLRQVPLRGIHLHGIQHGTNSVADPFLHRLQEINNMWNVVIKALVHEKLGDGILSTSDFGLDVSTVEKGNGNQFVKITMCGKFEPFRKF